MNQTVRRSLLCLIVALFQASCAQSTQLIAEEDPIVSVAPEEEIQELRVQLEEQRNQIEQLGATVEALEATLKGAKKRKPSKRKQKVRRPKKVRLKGSTPKSTKSLIVSDSSHQLMHLYVRAKQAMGDKDWERATGLLRRLIKLEPRHVYADRVQYLIFECQYQRGEFALLLNDSKYFEARYPYSFRLPDLLWRRALALESLGRKPFAKSHLERLLREFPNHPLIPSAKKRLASHAA